MWIILTLICAFVQSLWMALSKRQLQTLTPLRFMLFFRIPVALALVPAFLWCDPARATPRFWLLAAMAAVLECVRLLSFAHGTRRDYYATYSLKNTAPVWVLLLAPHLLGERLTTPVVCGALSVVVGGFVFYHAGRFQIAGLVAGVSQGAITTLFKLGMSLSNPIYFTFVVYALSTAILFAMESARSGPRPTLAAFGRGAKDTLPLSGLNVVAMLTYIFALHMAPATHFTILFRTSLIFGFVLSFFVLKEHEGWRAKLIGAAFILLGCVLIALKSAA